MTTNNDQPLQSVIASQESAANYMQRIAFDPVVPCSVCGEPAWWLCNIGANAGRYFCQEHEITEADALMTQPTSVDGETR